MSRKDGIKQQFVDAARSAIGRYPYISLAIFVMIVCLVSLAGYARYQHVQAEIAAQQAVPARVQRAFSGWSDDLSRRVNDLKGGIQGTAQAAGNIVGGALGIVSYLIIAVLDYIGNLHIMIPVTVIYFGVGFFGTPKMRVATLIGAVIAFFVSTRLGIVPASVIGLFVVAGLLFGDKLDPRWLSKIQDLPAWLRSKYKQLRDRFDQRDAQESEPEEEEPTNP